MSRFARSVVVDVTPLRASRRFRWLYLGQVGAQLSRHVLVVAVPYQVFVLTGSSFLVGMAGLVQVVPLLLSSLVGGSVADAFDRRKVLVYVHVALCLTSVGFAVNSGDGAALWPIFVLIATNAALSGVEGPTRAATIPSLVLPSQLATAFALYQALLQSAQVVVPAIAGLLIAQVGIGATYWVSAVASLATAVALVPLGRSTPDGARGRITLEDTVEGWRYLRRTPLLQQVMLIDVNAMVLAMPRALFPVVGTVVLGGDAATVGLLYAAPGAGALLGALTTGWVSTVRRQGRVVLYAVMVWGLSVAAFGLTRDLPAALLFLAVGGAADVVSNVFRNTILKMTVPDGLRGRLTAYNMALTGGGPRLGDARAGAVATMTSPAVSVVSGGLACAAGAVLIAWRGRTLWAQTTEQEEHGGQASAVT